jgi:hypothetical protein
MVVRMMVSGRSRQLMVTKLKRRCSILFHFEVPGGGVARRHQHRKWRRH